MNLKFPDRLQKKKNTQTPNFMKILSVSCSMRTDRRTDMTKQFYELAYRLLINEQLCKRNMELMNKIVRINCRIVHLLLLYELFCSS